MNVTPDPHQAFLDLLNNPPTEGPRGTLLGPTPCTSPKELEAALPAKIRYIGPGAWYAYLKTRSQEE